MKIKQLYRSAIYPHNDIARLRANGQLDIIDVKVVNSRPYFTPFSALEIANSAPYLTEQGIYKLYFGVDDFIAVTTSG